MEKLGGYGGADLLRRDLGEEICGRGNDWGNTQRIQLEPGNFACLNYGSEIYRQVLDGGDPDNYKRHANKLCLAPGDNGCIQAKLDRSSGFDVVPPQDLNVSTTMLLDTTPGEVPGGGSRNLVQNKSSNVPYMPIPYPTRMPVDTEDENGPYNFFATPDYSALSIYFPHYIGGLQNVIGVPPDIFIDYRDVDGVQLGSPVRLGNTSDANCDSATNSNALALPIGSYCLTVDSRGFQVMHVRANRIIRPWWMGTSRIGNMPACRFRSTLPEAPPFATMETGRDCPTRRTWRTVPGEGDGRKFYR